MVWEYVVPVDDRGPIYQCWAPRDNASFRAPRYDPKYPAFAGRTLTPMGPIELDPTLVDEGALEPVRGFLSQNYPNPFRPATTIEFWLRAPAPVALDVYDVAGRHVSTLLEGNLEIGGHRFRDVLATYSTLEDGGSKEDEIMVGLGIFARFHVVFDYTRHRLFVKPNGKFRDPFEMPVARR